MERVLACGVILGLVLVGSPSLPAQAEGEGAVTIEDLQRRIAQLEAEQSALRDELRGEGTDEAAPDAPPAGGEPKKESMWSTVGVQLYGFVKVDGSWDSARVDQGDYARWVISPDQGGDDGQFNLTANQTRLGLKLYGPKLEGVTTGGLVEMDFYGGGAENKANPMLRKAYLTIAWETLDMKLLAGQDSDIISPLYPETVNYTIQWWGGNIGYRRPQARLTKGYALGEKMRLDFTVGITRTIGDTTFYSPGDTGEDSGFPTTASRLALSFPLLATKPTEIGVSGHWGQEEYDVDVTNEDVDFDTWSFNVDLLLPVLEKLTLKAEGFIGENLDTYLGGIGQGTAVDAPGGVFNGGEALKAYGGWVAAGIGPFGSLRFNVGSSVDYVADSPFLAPEARRVNWAVFGNAFYRFYECMELGFEVSYWETRYKGIEDGDAVRVQTALILHF